MMMSRRVLIALFAMLTELVIVAATGNQAMIDYLTRHDKTLWTAEVRDAFLSFAWRVSPVSGQTTVYVGQFVAIATLLVLTFLLVIVVLRGAASFSGAFFTTACVSVAAAVVANMVESVVDYNQNLTGGTSGQRISVALVEGSRNPGLSAYSVALGLVAGIAAGCVGSALRRRSIGQLEPGGFAPGPVPNPYGPTDGFGSGELAASGFGGGGYYPQEPTAELPRMPEPSGLAPTEPVPAGQFAYPSPYPPHVGTDRPNVVTGERPAAETGIIASPPVPEPAPDSQPAPEPAPDSPPESDSSDTPAHDRS